MNLRTPSGADLESATFVHSVTPASVLGSEYYAQHIIFYICGLQLGTYKERHTIIVAAEDI